jgi:hypothetical protein
MSAIISVKRPQIAKIRDAMFAGKKSLDLASALMTDALIDDSKFASDSPIANLIDLIHDLDALIKDTSADSDWIEVVEASDSDLEDFKGFCKNATSSQLQNIYAKEKKAGRDDYADVAKEEMEARGIDFEESNEYHTEGVCTKCHQEKMCDDDGVCKSCVEKSESKNYNRKGDKMNTASKVLGLCEEVIGKPMPAAKDLKGGETVIFKAGTELEGMMGIISQVEKDGKVGVKVGNANRFEVAMSDLLLVDQESQFHVATPAAPAAKDQPVTTEAPQAPAPAESPVTMTAQ